jgi:YidC/Oxa1 family membrane protein insertase
LNEHRNMILAIVLSAIVLFGWSALSERYFPTASEPSTKIVDGRAEAIQQRSGSPTGPQASAAAAPAGVRPAPRVRIETPRLSGSINLRGARIDDLLLTQHRRTIDRNSPPVRLFAPEGAAHAYFGSFGWSGDGLAAPDNETVWRPSAPVLAPGRPVTLSWDNGRGQLFEIVLSVDDGYMFTAEQRVTNRGAGPIAARPYALINRVGPSPDPDSWTMHVGPVGYFNDAADYGHNWDDVVAAGSQSQSSTGGWLGFTDKYWLAAVVPNQSGNVETSFRHNPATNSFQADFQAAPAIVGPGQAMRYTSRLFAGAKELELLDRYADDEGVPRLDKAIDWGWFEWFMKPIFSLLTWLFHLIGNFGFAIIGLTVIVRLLLFPIAQRQFASMAAMRVLQPKVKVLQERYKDDKPRMQQEMLKLYKEEKVNPMAGCLPIVLQIPIWYGLYKVLLLAVEMRHEPFALWIHDLSAPDPLSPVNLFGFLPFTPPSIVAIGVLPILVAITMWAQMKLNPAPMDPVQKQVFAFMPWVLMVVMAPFAAGLQLYWLTGNILTIAQQKFLYSRYPGLRSEPASAAAAAPAAAVAEVVADATGGGGKGRRKKK